MLDENLLTFENYKIELEENEDKKRTGIYINNDVTYERRKDLEKPNCHIVIVDISTAKEYRLINVYRSFSANNNVTPFDQFNIQLNIIKIA